MDLAKNCAEDLSHRGKPPLPSVEFIILPHIAASMHWYNGTNKGLASEAR
jgi:hypothetical protein